MLKERNGNYLLYNQRLKVTRLDKNLEIALEALDKKEIVSLLKSYIHQTSIHRSADMDRKEKYYYLMSLFIAFIQKKGWYIHEVLYTNDIYKIDRKEITSHHELVNVFEDISDKILQNIQKDGQPQNKLVQQVISFVEERIYEDISLKDAAESIYVNSSYLSRLFSKEVGMSFSHYVMERKMLLAKTLLQNGDKISVVSQKLAYKDVSYFTKVFRRYWGMTPREMLTTVKTEGVKAAFS
ncbi:YesN/AraC family two-component response regulator [Evansella vedderi]|uniref:YesN/AraC family two-component response regulator n=1 Tax=Evansella vedderi TaxID=38282 RepID=A0ABT9ZS65_9BACI|nr:helix-turn-helix domain-containing protein [Evansella vedderi]MDQ0253015.1 YesN/AraC family two-component response regulator [Evansella vedderi]